MAKKEEDQKGEKLSLPKIPKMKKSADNKKSFDNRDFRRKMLYTFEVLDIYGHLCSVEAGESLHLGMSSKPY